jgi:hypothetical protein
MTKVVVFLLPSFEDGKSSSHRNVLLSSYLELWTSDKVLKLSYDKY